MKASYCKKDVIKALCDVGLKRGDDVFIHSNLGFFGICEGVKNADDLCEVFLSSFREVIGDEGTLIVPTFSYSACSGKSFDPESNNFKMGIFSDYVFKNELSVRSRDPNFSVVAIGKKATYYTENPTEHSFGAGSFFDRLYRQKAKICCLNFDAGTTFIHYVEKSLEVPYRYDKHFPAEIITTWGTEKKDSVHFVYSYEKPRDTPFSERLHEISIANGVAKTAFLGRGMLLLQSSNELYDLIKNTLAYRPRFLLKEE